MFQTKVAEKTKTHNLCSTLLLRKILPNNTMWKNILDRDRTHITLQ